MQNFLKQYVRHVLYEIRTQQIQKKLRIFDFDDTLVKTKSLIHVTNATGEIFDLTPGEFAVYVPRPGDVFDYSDFSKLIDPQEIVWTVRILKNIISKGSEVVILTARATPKPVEQFLQDADLPTIPIVALADADPQKKADYIASRIEREGFTHVEFFDDSHKNILAVQELAALYPNTRIIARHIKH